MRRITTAALLMATLAAAGCGDDDTSTTPAPGGDVVLRVVRDGEVLAEWTLARLEAEVPFSTAIVDGDEQSGPKLIDVLAASGAEEWSTGEALGLGEGRGLEVGVEFAAGEVDDGWILDVTNRGTLKLASDDLPRQQWVRDVAEITLR